MSYRPGFGTKICVLSCRLTQKTFRSPSHLLDALNAQKPWFKCYFSSMSHLINLIFCPNFRSKIFLDCEKFSGYSEVSDFSGFRRDVSKYRRARIQGVENRDPLPRYTSILFGNLFVLFIVVLLLYSVLCKFHDVCRYHISPKVSSYFAFGGPYLNAPIKPY